MNSRSRTSRPAGRTMLQALAAAAAATSLLLTGCVAGEDSDAAANANAEIGRAHV